MPRGNEAAAAAAELANSFAAGEAKAEDLVAINRERYSDELRAAQLKDRNEEATAELDWAKAADACDVDAEDLIDCAVRGDQVVVVYEDERGDAHKAVCWADEAGVELPQVGSRALQRRREAAQEAIARKAEEAEAAKAEKPKRSPRKRSSSSRKSSGSKRSTAKSKRSTAKSKG